VQAGSAGQQEVTVTQPAGPDTAEWQLRWTIDAGAVILEPATRSLAQAVLDGGPGPREFEDGARHDRIRYAMGFAIRDIDSGAAAILPTVWVVVRRADGRIIGDIGTHGPPGSAGCVEIGYSLAPSARGQGTGTSAVAALVGCLSAVPGIRRITAVTGADNIPSRRLLERLGFRVDGSLPDTGEVRYGLSVS
jgi:RimJ/RimL family protein N-acetyltransferase